MRHLSKLAMKPKSHVIRKGGDKVTLGIIVNGVHSIRTPTFKHTMRAVAKLRGVETKVIRSDRSHKFITNSALVEMGVPELEIYDDGDMFADYRNDKSTATFQDIYRACDAFVLFSSVSSTNRMAVGVWDALQLLVLAQSLDDEVPGKRVLSFPSAARSLMANSIFKGNVERLHGLGWEFHFGQRGSLPKVDEMVGHISSLVRQVETDDKAIDKAGPVENDLSKMLQFHVKVEEKEKEANELREEANELRGELEKYKEKYG